MNILILEDNRSLCEAITNSLQYECPCNCIPVIDYYEAVETINTIGFEWIISDWKLSTEKSGIDFLQLCREINPKIKTILISGYKEVNDEDTINADYVLEKHPKLVSNIISIIKRDFNMDNERCDRNESLIKNLTLKIQSCENKMDKVMQVTEDTQHIKKGVTDINEFLIGTKQKEGFITEQKSENKTIGGKVKLLFWLNSLMLAAIFGAWINVILK